jgi:hypothetical protein
VIRGQVENFYHDKEVVVNFGGIVTHFHCTVSTMILLCCTCVACCCSLPYVALALFSMPSFSSFSLLP